jgi:hypothetical protein
MSMRRHLPSFTVVIFALLASVAVAFAVWSERRPDQIDVLTRPGHPATACQTAQAQAQTTTHALVHATVRVSLPITVAEQVVAPGRGAIVAARRGTLVEQAPISRSVEVSAVATGVRRACAHGASLQAARGLALQEAYQSALAVARRRASRLATARAAALAAAIRPRAVAHARALLLARARAIAAAASSVPG